MSGLDLPMKAVNSFVAKAHASFDSMFEVSRLFHKLNQDAAGDLEDGVKRIQKEEQDQSMCPWPRRGL